jgi:hypothetical protein
MLNCNHRDRAKTDPKGLAMRGARIVVLTVAVAIVAVAQTSVSVTELPPEAIPAGTCTQSQPGGYLGIVEKDKTERTKLSDAEIGAYVRKSLAQGYSIALYPQASGKIFTQQTCHPAKP